MTMQLIIPIFLAIVWAVILMKIGFSIIVTIRNRSKGKKETGDDAPTTDGGALEAAYAEVAADLPPYHWTNTLIH